MKTKQTAGRFRLQSVVPWIIYVLIALILALLQMSPNGFPTIAHARPEPLILFTVCVGMLEGPTIGSVMGVVSGLLWNLYSSRLFGYHGLILMVIGLAAALLVQWLLRTNFWSALLLCSGAVVLYTLLDWLLCYVLFMNDEMTLVFTKVYLPNALYTILLAPLMYWLILLVARMLRRKRTNN